MFFLDEEEEMDRLRVTARASAPCSLSLSRPSSVPSRVVPFVRLLCGLCVASRSFIPSLSFVFLLSSFAFRHLCV
jgi:hypothetical protein